VSIDCGDDGANDCESVVKSVAGIMMVVIEQLVQDNYNVVGSKSISETYLFSGLNSLRRTKESDRDC